jgi:hypothetical protein
VYVCVHVLDLYGTVYCIRRSAQHSSYREPSSIHFNNQAAQPDKAGITGITIDCDVSDVVIKLFIATIQQIAHLGDPDTLRNK